MDDDGISIATVTPLPLAAVRRQVTAANLAIQVVGAPVWSLIEQRGLRSLDQAVVIYHERGTATRLAEPDGVAADIGVLLAEPFEGDRSLQCVMTPAGRVARFRHHGHYELLPVVHADIRAWCLDRGHAITGTNWEHFTQWHEDPERLVTDIYYLLR
jgi:effector-binding domain-containing protein